jgi:hypothetical protein
MYAFYYQLVLCYAVVVSSFSIVLCAALYRRNYHTEGYLFLSGFVLLKDKTRHIKQVGKGNIIVILSSSIKRLQS